VVKTHTDTCFFCRNVGKCRQFTFYSGIMKGGTTHRMLSCTVTFFERWSDLTMHDIQVCRECQVRLWRRKHFAPMVLCALGAGVFGLVVLAALLFLSGTARFGAAGFAVVPALVLGGVFVVMLRRYLNRKPRHDELEPLVVDQAIDLLPKRGHTFMTSEQYLERYKRGVIGG
jgi:hypothetical protein